MKKHFIFLFVFSLLLFMQKSRAVTFNGTPHKNLSANYENCCGSKTDLSSGFNGTAYPDFLAENEDDTEVLNQILQNGDLLFQLINYSAGHFCVIQKNTDPGSGILLTKKNILNSVFRL